MSKIFRFRLWCAGLALLANQASAAGVPAFLITTPGGVSSVLMGTLHVPAAGMRQPADQVMKAPGISWWSRQGRRRLGAGLLCPQRPP